MLNIAQLAFQPHDYDRQFQDLLSINEETTIVDVALLETPKPTFFSPSKVLLTGRTWKTYHPSEKKTYSKEQLVCRKLKEWNMHIADALRFARYRPELLKQLQKTIQKVVDESKIPLIYQQLSQNSLNTEKNKDPYERLEILVNEVVSTPLIDPRAAYQLPPPISHHCQIPLTSQGRNVLKFRPDSSNEWISEMTDAFKKLESTEDVMAVAARLSDVQAHHLIQRILQDKDCEGRLCYLVGNLQTSVLESIALAIDEPSLSLLNQVFSAAEAETRDWLINIFQSVHQQNIIDTCNLLTQSVNNLCYLLRQDPRGNKMTSNQIEDIKHLSDLVQQHQTSIQKLFILLNGVANHPETKHVLFEGTKKDLETLYTRLTETQEYPNRAPGCVWGIVYRNVFERPEMKDFDKADEIFSDWDVITPNDHLEVGLFGNLSVSGHKKLKEIFKSDDELRTRAVDNLKLLDISKISDWKTFEIFNKNMLKQFLSRRDNKEKIESAMREFLPDDEFFETSVQS